MNLDEIGIIAREVYSGLSFADSRDRIIVDLDEGEVTVKYISAGVVIRDEAAYSFSTFDIYDLSTWGDDFTFVPERICSIDCLSGEIISTPVYCCHYL